MEARFGLEPDLADRLRASNILYDRDDKGEFFQLYAPTFGEGFIFEIVERRGAYAGYGAAERAVPDRRAEAHDAAQGDAEDLMAQRLDRLPTTIALPDDWLDASVAREDADLERRAACSALRPRRPPRMGKLHD